MVIKPLNRNNQIKETGNELAMNTDMGFASQIIGKYNRRGQYFFHGIALTYLKLNHEEGQNTLENSPVYLSLKLLLAYNFQELYEGQTVNREMYLVNMRKILGNYLNQLKQSNGKGYQYINNIYRLVRETKDRANREKLQEILEEQLQRFQATDRQLLSEEQKHAVKQISEVSLHKRQDRIRDNIREIQEGGYPGNYEDGNHEIKNIGIENIEVENIETKNTEIRDTEIRNTEIGNAEIGNREIGNTEIGNAETRNTEIRNIEIGNTKTRNTEIRNTETKNTEEKNMAAGHTVEELQTGEEQAGVPRVEDGFEEYVRLLRSYHFLLEPEAGLQDPGSLGLRPQDTGLQEQGEKDNGAASDIYFDYSHPVANLIYKREGSLQSEEKLTAIIGQLEMFAEKQNELGMQLGFGRQLGLGMLDPASRKLLLHTLGQMFSEDGKLKGFVGELNRRQISAGDFKQFLERMAVDSRIVFHKEEFIKFLKNSPRKFQRELAYLAKQEGLLSQEEADGASASEDGTLGKPAHRSKKDKIVSGFQSMGSEDLCRLMELLLEKEPPLFEALISNKLIEVEETGNYQYREEDAQPGQTGLRVEQENTLANSDYIENIGARKTGIEDVVWNKGDFGEYARLFSSYNFPLEPEVRTQELREEGRGADTAIYIDRSNLVADLVYKREGAFRGEEKLAAIIGQLGIPTEQQHELGMQLGLGILDPASRNMLLHALGQVFSEDGRQKEFIEKLNHRKISAGDFRQFLERMETDRRLILRKGNFIDFLKNSSRELQSEVVALAKQEGLLSQEATDGALAPEAKKPEEHLEQKDKMMDGIKSMSRADTIHLVEALLRKEPSLFEALVSDKSIEVEETRNYRYRKEEDHSRLIEGRQQGIDKEWSQGKGGLPGESGLEQRRILELAEVLKQENLLVRGSAMEQERIYAQERAMEQEGMSEQAGIIEGRKIPGAEMILRQEKNLDRTRSAEQEGNKAQERTLEEARLVELEKILERAKAMEQGGILEKAKAVELEKILEQAKAIEQGRIPEETRAIELEKILEQAKAIEHSRILEEGRAIERERVLERARLIEKEKILEREGILEKERILERERLLEQEKVLEQVKLIGREGILEQVRGIEKENTHRQGQMLEPEMILRLGRTLEQSGGPDGVRGQALLQSLGILGRTNRVHNKLSLEQEKDTLPQQLRPAIKTLARDIIHQDLQERNTLLQTRLVRGTLQEGYLKQWDHIGRQWLMKRQGGQGGREAATGQSPELPQAAGLTHKQGKPFAVREENVRKLVNEYIVTEQVQMNHSNQRHKESAQELSLQKKELKKLKETMQVQKQSMEEMKRQLSSDKGAQAGIDMDRVTRDIMKKIERQLFVARLRKGL